jgi:chromosome segregation ATPase
MKLRNITVKGVYRMAISKEDIYAAIEAINSVGKKPTTITIREHLGTGSLGTINPVLKEWREAQAPSTLPCVTPQIPVPQPFIDGVQAIIPQLWTVAAETANTILTTERTAWTAERDVLKANLEELTALEAAANTDLEDLQAKFERLEFSITDLEKDHILNIDDLKKKHAAALDEEITARIAAGQATAVLQGVNEQLNNRLEDLFTVLDETKTQAKSLLATNNDLMAGLNTATEKITEQANARIAAEQAAASLQATNDQLQTRLDDLQLRLSESKAATQAAERRTAMAETTIKTLTDNLEMTRALCTKLTEDIHAAEKRAVAAESTAAAQTSHIKNLTAANKTALAEIADLSARQ